MHPSNPPPLNTSFSSVNSSKRASDALEPYVLHVISGVIRDLQFLHQQGYISLSTMEEITERLPKIVGNAIPHTPPAPSPFSSPVPHQKSPVASVKSDTRHSTTSTPQRPLSSSSSHTSQHQQQHQQQHHQQHQQQQLLLQQQQQQQQLQLQQQQQLQLQQQQQQREQREQQEQQERQLHSLETLEQNNVIEVEDEIQDQHIGTPSQLQNFPLPPSTHLTPNDNDVSAGQSHLEPTQKPAVPSRDSVYQPTIIPEQSYSNTGGTGAILATRPLPLPPNANANTSSPPRPQPLPVFDQKHEEAEYEKSMNRLQLVDNVLPAYSLAVVEAMWDFMSGDIGDLSFSKGDIVEVVEYVNMDWWRGRIQGTNKIGIFPKIYTKILPAQVQQQIQQQIQQVQQVQQVQQISQVSQVSQASLNQGIPDQSNVTNNTVYYTQRPNPSYSTQQIRYQPSQSPSQLQSQNQNQNYAYQQQSVYYNSNASQPNLYINTRNSTNSNNVRPY